MVPDALLPACRGTLSYQQHGLSDTKVYEPVPAALLPAMVVLCWRLLPAIVLLCSRLRSASAAALRSASAAMRPVVTPHLHCSRA